jgi:hypothetical protein
MDPLSILSTLISVTKYLQGVSDKVQQNRDECQRLAIHARDVFAMIEVEIRDGYKKVEMLSQLEKLKLWARWHENGMGKHYWPYLIQHVGRLEFDTGRAFQSINTEENFVER